MVTLIKYGALSGGEKYNVNVLSLDGLSTDTKPTRTFIEYGSDGREVGRTGIPNGSLYTEIDTGDTYMYDADGTTWYKVSLGGGGSGFSPTTAQLASMNSGITSTDVQQINTNKTNISSLMPTGYTAPTVAAEYSENISIAWGGYAKVGNLCIINIRFSTNTDIPVGKVILLGLPKPAEVSSLGQGAIFCALTNSLNLNIGVIKGVNTGSIANNTLSSTISAGNVILSGFYLCD